MTFDYKSNEDTVKIDSIVPLKWSQEGNIPVTIFGKFDLAVELGIERFSFGDEDLTNAISLLDSTRLVFTLPAVSQSQSTGQR